MISRCEKGEARDVRQVFNARRHMSTHVKHTDSSFTVPMFYSHCIATCNYAAVEFKIFYHTDEYLFPACVRCS